MPRGTLGPSRLRFLGWYLLFMAWRRSIRRDRPARRTAGYFWGSVDGRRSPTLDGRTVFPRFFATGRPRRERPPGPSGPSLYSRHGPGVPSNPSHLPPERIRASLPRSRRAASFLVASPGAARGRSPEASYRIYLEPLRSAGPRRRRLAGGWPLLRRRNRLGHRPLRQRPAGPVPPLRSGPDIEARRPGRRSPATSDAAAPSRRPPSSDLPPSTPSNKTFRTQFVIGDGKKPPGPRRRARRGELPGPSHNPPLHLRTPPPGPPSQDAPAPRHSPSTNLHRNRPLG